MNGAYGGLGLCKLGQGPAGSEEESFSGLTEAFSPSTLFPPLKVGTLISRSAEINSIPAESKRFNSW